MRGRQPVGARRQADGFAELAGERGLVGVAAFERQFAQRRVGAPEPVARPPDAQPGQILAGREAEQSPQPLVELERRQAGSRGEIGNAQRLVEMVVDIGERGGKRRRNQAGPRQRRGVAGNADKASNGAIGVHERLFPGQAPAFAAVGIEMKLQPAADRQAVRDDLEILSLETLAERGRKSLARLAADKRSLVGEAAAFGERLVDRDVARLAILDEEYDVGDMVEKFDRRKRSPERGGKRGRGIILGRAGRFFAHFQAAARLFIKIVR